MHLSGMLLFFQILIYFLIERRHNGSKVMTKGLWVTTITILCPLSLRWINFNPSMCTSLNKDIYSAHWATTTISKIYLGAFPKSIGSAFRPRKPGPGRVSTILRIPHNHAHWHLVADVGIRECDDCLQHLLIRWGDMDTCTAVTID